MLVDLRGPIAQVTGTIRTDRRMKQTRKPDLSGAYGDRDETLSWPAFIGVILYSVTIGWIVALARFIRLWVTGRRERRDAAP